MMYGHHLHDHPPLATKLESPMVPCCMYMCLATSYLLLVRDSSPLMHGGLNRN